MRAAIVTVGDELLAGETENTNATWLCDRLDGRGVDVDRVTVVPDRIEDIASVVEEYSRAYDAVIVTGGLGPTHDDVTMDAVATAFDRDLRHSDEAMDWLVEEGGYARGDLVDGTAHLPAGARVLHNEAGVAPGCVVENVYVLPGVPDEMTAMFRSIADEFSGTERHSRVVAADEPESGLLDRLRELRDRYPVTVGSYPGDVVRVKITAADEATVEAAADWLRERVDGPGSDSETSTPGREP